jgi:hypothetical protein
MMSRFRILKRPKVILSLVVILLVLTAIVTALRNLNSPAHGTVATQNTASQPAATSSLKENKEYSGAAITFSFPSKFEISPSTKSPGYLDSVSLITSDRRDEYAAISVTKDTFDTDSGISYRRNHPDLYKTNLKSSNSIVFTKLDSTELTGFFQYGDKLASVSLTSVAGKDMSADYVVIADSLQWKQ